MTARIRPKRKEMWVSHNRVLVGSGGGLSAKKAHVRNPNFETEETKLLISLWGDPKVQKTLITSHKKYPIIVKLSEKMHEHGYFRTPEEINTRLKNLKCFYNRIKKDLESGSVRTATWKHFEAMDEILTRPIFGNRALDSTSLADDDNSGMDFSFDEDDSRDLRPEDLLSVETAQRSSDFKDEPIDIKDEPLDADETPEQQTPAESSPPKSASSEIPKLIPRYSWLQNSTPKPPLAQQQPLPTKNIVCINSAMANRIENQDPQQKAKISLVPTNFLLKSSTPGNQIAQKGQFYLPNNLNRISAIGNAQKVQNPVNSNGMPMKVLLVNTLPNQKQPQPHANLTTKPLDSNPPKSDEKIHPRKLVRGFRRRIRSESDEATMLGIRAMLKQLIKSQEVTNDLNEKRLVFEREKWETQKTFYEDLHKLVPAVNFLVDHLKTRQPSETLSSVNDPVNSERINSVQENGH